MIETISGNYTIKQIFQDNDNWARFKLKYGNKLRPVIIEEVEKMLRCRDPLLSGYHLYRCPKCNRVERIVPHSCKSRFCSSCGKVAVDNWIDKALGDFLDVPYHHLVFTIPQELRNIFLYNRQLLNLLFRAASRTVLEWCQKTGGYLPGLVGVLHTFGSTLEFNPHLHLLITEGGLNSAKNSWINNEYIPWSMLKARWRYWVITLLRPELKKMIAKRQVGPEYQRLGNSCSFFLFLGQTLSEDLVCLDGNQIN